MAVPWGVMKHRIVTVFGGTGFLGRRVVRRLAAAGVRVRVAARSPDAVDFPDLSTAVVCTRADVRDEAQVVAALRGADAAVNAVSLYVERGGLDFESVHVGGAGRIARLGREAGLHQLVHISGIGADAGSPSAYVRARARGEAAVLEAWPAATVLRPSVLFGEDDSFLRTLDSMTRLPVIPLFGNGNTRLQPVYVEDVAEAVFSTLKLGAGGIFELGGADVLRYREIVQAVLRHRGRRRLLLPLPFPLWRALAGGTGRLPAAPLTRDQVLLMQQDNVVGRNVADFDDLHVRPRGLLELLPLCLPR